MMNKYSDDRLRQTTIDGWNNAALTSWWLRNGVSIPRGRRFHSRKNMSYEKNYLEFISIFWLYISLSLEELVPVMVTIIIFREVA